MRLQATVLLAALAGIGLASHQAAAQGADRVKKVVPDSSSHMMKRPSPATRPRRVRGGPATLWVGYQAISNRRSLDPSWDITYR